VRLLALAATALQLQISTPGAGHLPRSLAVVKTYNRMQQARRALASGRVQRPITVDENRDGTIANITVPIEATGTDAASNASVAVLRDAIVPATVGALPNAEAGVTGLTAEWKDQQDQMKSKLPLVVVFVLLFAFGLMLVAFRSIVVAIKAIVLNLVSVAAAYGVLVLVFQQQGTAGAQLCRDRSRHADAAVRDPLRALDGLPRLHRQPDPGDVRRWREHG
jgi:uncharacterized membrane protein YdfJ with MMPL/SSD domain